MTQTKEVANELNSSTLLAIRRQVSGVYFTVLGLKVGRSVQPCVGVRMINISPVVTIRIARFNIHNFYVLPTQCIYVFCVDLRTNRDYFPIQH
jgi:hypothetical protein